MRRLDFIIHRPLRKWLTESSRVLPNSGMIKYNWKPLWLALERTSLGNSLCQKRLFRTGGPLERIDTQQQNTDKDSGRKIHSWTLSQWMHWQRRNLSMDKKPLHVKDSDSIQELESSQVPNALNKNNSTRLSSSAYSASLKAFHAARQSLLDHTPSFWSRSRLRMKLFLTGYHPRPFASDDFLAFGSWFFVGHSLFILLATTTFFSLVVLVVNTLEFQEYFAKIISKELVKQTGYDITFESAIVPRWREGTLRLENVNVFCNDSSYRDLVKQLAKEKGLTPPSDEEIDVNWTYWDVQIRSVDVTLSVWRWLDGKGFVKECRMKGVRGNLDRRHITWKEDWVPFRRSPAFGDFELTEFVLEDLLLTIYNPDFRPYSVSIFHATLPNLRKQWLLYDFFCADSMVGVLDDCLFSVHKPQRDDLVLDEKTKGAWAKMSHLKINGLPIDHFKAGATGPLSWITHGKLDLDLHILIPQSPPSDDVLELIRSEMDDIKHTAIGKLEKLVENHPEREHYQSLRERKKSQQMEKQVRDYGTWHPQFDEPSDSKSVQETSMLPPVPEGPPSMIMFWNVKLNDLKASVPIKPRELSYMTATWIRPVVAYMNANRTSMEFSFDARMDVQNFNGSWDFYSSGLIDVLSEELGRALATLAQDHKEQHRRLLQISLWSLQSVTRQLVDLIEYTTRIGSHRFKEWAEKSQAHVNYLRRSWGKGATWFE